MGCSSNNKIDCIENKMMSLKLKKKKIQLEREIKLKKLEGMVGKEIIRDSIDDYEESEEDSDSYDNNNNDRKNEDDLHKIICIKNFNVKSFYDK